MQGGMPAESEELEPITVETWGKSLLLLQGDVSTIWNLLIIRI